MKYIILSAFIIFHIGCSSTVHQIDYKSMASEKYGDHVRFLFNTSNSSVVCIRSDTATALNPIPYLKFFIFDFKNNKVIHEAEVPGGSIQWLDNFRVEIKSKPEVMSSNDKLMSRSYIFDIRNTD